MWAVQRLPLDSDPRTFPDIIDKLPVSVKCDDRIAVQGVESVCVTVNGDTAFQLLPIERQSRMIPEIIVASRVGIEVI